MENTMTIREVNREEFRIAVNATSCEAKIHEFPKEGELELEVTRYWTNDGTIIGTKFRFADGRVLYFARA